MMDWSHWQDDNSKPGTPNIKLASTSVPAMIFKAGQGLVPDEDFSSYMAEAKEYGIHRGAYYFYDNRVAPKAQAKKWAEIMTPDLGELPLWVDWERDYPQALPSRWQDIYDFITELERLLPNKKIGIYTGYYWWVAKTKPTLISELQLHWFSKYPLWIAAYPTHDTSRPQDVRIPKPWTEWTIWQYTDRITKDISGADSNEADGNTFNLPRQEWLKKWSTMEIVTTPDIEEEENSVIARYNCVARFDVKVRETPDTLNVTNTKILKGTSFQVSELVPDRLDPTNPNKVWGKIFGGQHNGKYTALEYPGNQNPLSTYTEIPVDNGGGVNEVTLTHTIEVYSDGSIKIDGKPY